MKFNPRKSTYILGGVLFAKRDFVAPVKEEKPRAEWIVDGKPATREQYLASFSADRCDRNAVGLVHDSDCAIYNMPALPNGPCNCSVKERRMQQSAAMEVREHGATDYVPPAPAAPSWRPVKGERVEVLCGDGKWRETVVVAFTLGRLYEVETELTGMYGNCSQWSLPNCRPLTAPAQKDGWIEWNGGDECPIKPGQKAIVRFQDGKEEKASPTFYQCNTLYNAAYHKPGFRYIIAYRLAEGSKP